MFSDDNRLASDDEGDDLGRRRARHEKDNLIEDDEEGEVEDEEDFIVDDQGTPKIGKKLFNQKIGTKI